jgi:urea transport system permease protein
MIPRFFFLLLMLFGCVAHAAPDPALVRQLAAEESDDKITAIQKLALTAEPEALAVLQQLADGSLKDDKGEEITLNNRVRRELEGALAVLKLIDPDAVVRLKAVKEIAGNVDASMAPMLAKARDRETEPKIRALLVEAHALATLKDADPQLRIAAAQALATSADPNTQAALKAQSEPANEAETEVRRAAFRSYLEVKDRLTLAENIGRVFSGLSLGSILLLAALGLAITYGVMGVINMAHGELLMIGAYATYAVQACSAATSPTSSTGTCWPPCRWPSSPPPRSACCWSAR